MRFTAFRSPSDPAAHMADASLVEDVQLIEAVALQRVTAEQSVQIADGTPVHAGDDRIASTDMGAWLVASAAGFAVPGVASIAFLEQWGPHGIAGHPAATAFAMLRQFEGSSFWVAEALRDDLVWALTFGDESTPDVLVANLDAVERTVQIVVDEKLIDITVPASDWVLTS